MTELLNDKNVTTFQVGRDRIRVGTNGDTLALPAGTSC